MNLKKKDNSVPKPSFYDILLVAVGIISVALITMLFACIPLGIMWFVLIGVLEYDISIRVIYWFSYVLTFIITIFFLIED